MSTRGHSNNLDFLRLVLAALVILSHAYGLAGGERAMQEPLRRLVGHDDIALGIVAVNGFFVVSGYLITASFQRSAGLRDYLTKRVLRLYPGFLIAYAATVLIVPPLVFGRWGTGHPWWLHVAHAMFLDAPPYAPGLGRGFLNSSMWTILPEFACYLMVAGLGIVGVWRSRGAATAVVVAGWLAYIVADAVRLPLPGRLADMPRLAAFFLLGAGVYVWRDRIRLTWPLVVAAGALAFAALFVRQIVPAVHAPAFALLILGAGLASTRGIRRAAYYGDFSYGLYLYAYPVQVALLFWHADWSPSTHIAVAVLVTAPLAAASWFLVERPVQRWRERVRRPAVVPAPAVIA